MMNYETDERSEGYEEAPRSFLRNQSRRSGRPRKALPLVLIGGGFVLCLVALVLVLATGENSREGVENKKTLELGGAENLPEAGSPEGVAVGSGPEALTSREGAPQTGTASQSRAADRMKSMLSDFESRMQANHDQVMNRLAELAKRVGKNTEHHRQSLKALEDLSARIERLETQYLSAAQAESGKETTESAEDDQARAKEDAQETEQKDASEAGSSEKAFYTVQKNDTLYSIAKDNGLEVETLLEINGLEEGAVIYPGDKLLVEP
ncbi:MAG: LysM peptidoglycan-binding domain-containing protein [Desulfobacteraceae bacterium]|nr:LysM peptidoglycan-binding domain-containing protein [Desulfobacteraceae bacterium]